MYTLLQLSFILIRYFLLLIFFSFHRLLLLDFSCVLLSSLAHGIFYFYIFNLDFQIFKFTVFGRKYEKKTMHMGERARAREETRTVSAIHKKICVVRTLLN